MKTTHHTDEQLAAAMRDLEAEMDAPFHASDTLSRMEAGEHWHTLNDERLNRQDPQFLTKDELWMEINRTIDSNPERYLEVAGERSRRYPPPMLTQTPSGSHSDPPRARG